MKKRMLLVAAIFSFGTIILLAQAPPKPMNDPSLGGTNGVSGSNGPVSHGPIDGGLGILLILGAGYAAKRLYDVKKVSP